MNSQRIGILVFFVIGLGLLAASALFARGAWVRHQELASHAAWPRVDGVVTEMTDARKPDGEVYYKAVIEWKGPDGRAYSQTSYPTHRTLGVGQKYPLRYDPADPSRAESPDATESWMGTLILGAMGVAFTGIAVRALLGERRRQPDGART